MAYRASTGDLSRGERWDRDRFLYERDRDRYGDERVRYEEDDRAYSREPRGLPARFRDLSVSVDNERYDRRPPPPGRPYDDEHAVRDRRYYHDDEPRFVRDRHSPTSSDFDRRVVIEKERVARSPSPRRRPATLLRRQSSLDTFDRRPRYWEHEEEQQRYGPPARREDFRPPTNVPIPLPRTRALPPPRRFAERDSYEEIRVSDPDYYGDEEFRPYPERIREKEVVRERRRDRSRSRDSHRSHRSGGGHHHHLHHHRGRSHHGTSVTTSTSRSSSTSSSSSSSSGGTTVKSEYPKKGKTRIPARLVSKRALIDLGYPFIEEVSILPSLPPSAHFAFAFYSSKQHTDREKSGQHCRRAESARTGEHR